MKKQEQNGVREEVPVESGRHETQEVVHKGRNRERRKLRVSYTNVNGLTSAQWETNSYLRDYNPDIMGLTETELCEVVKRPLHAHPPGQAVLGVLHHSPGAE